MCVGHTQTSNRRKCHMALAASAAAAAAQATAPVVCACVTTRPRRFLEGDNEEKKARNDEAYNFPALDH